MRADEIGEVHAIEVVTSEDQVVVRLVLEEVAYRLTHGIRGALEPVRALRCLLGRQDLDEAIAEVIQPVGLRDMAIERRRVELREDKDASQLGVKAITDWDVDKTVPAADGYRRFRPHVRQREEPRTAPAAEDECQDGVHRRCVWVETVFRSKVSGGGSRYSSLPSVLFSSTRRS